MYQRSGFGKSLVVGREADVQEKLEAAGLADAVSERQIVNAGNTQNLEVFKDLHYNRLKRKGLIGQMFTDVQPETDMFFRF
jgi:malate dehydrogenase (oxaloacetate-decarboxylating)(NADP+)